MYVVLYFFGMAPFYQPKRNLQLIMKRILFLLSFLAIGLLVFFSCKKYQDPPPTTDPRLTNHYCNDPLAVNYNWGFPGIPDNTKCFYPTDLFAGTYSFVDSVYDATQTYFLFADSLILTFKALSDTQISVSGFCSGAGNLRMTARSYVASMDSIIGDTLTPARGQQWCRLQDTVSGTITDNTIDTTLHVYLQIISDTGITFHTGRARKR